MKKKMFGLKELFEKLYIRLHNLEFFLTKAAKKINILNSFSVQKGFSSLKIPHYLLE